MFVIVCVQYQLHVRPLLHVSVFPWRGISLFVTVLFLIFLRPFRMHSCPVDGGDKSGKRFKVSLGVAQQNQLLSALSERDPFGNHSRLSSEMPGI